MLDRLRGAEARLPGRGTTPDSNLAPRRVARIGQLGAARIGHMADFLSLGTALDRAAALAHECETAKVPTNQVA
jgi:hypothetical protein